MSRVGKKPIPLPAGVKFNFTNGVVLIKGAKGELSQVVDTAFKIKEEDSNLIVERPTEQKRHKALHGLYRALIANMIEGVTNGFKLELELVGVGYKANAQANVLELSLGYSHNVFLGVPPEVKVTTAQEKGKNPMVTLEGIDKQLVGQIAAKLKDLRRVEPYKGKGIRFAGEVVRRKAGKSAAK